MIGKQIQKTVNYFIISKVIRLEKKSLLLIFIYFFSLLILSCTIQAKRTGFFNPKLIWSDEFEGNYLDENKWNYRNLGKRRDGLNVKEAISLDGNGNLIITTTRHGTEYHTGMIGTQGKLEYPFGYWEARMRFQREPGHWSAFWLQSPTIQKSGNVKKYGTEIDIIEFLTIKGDTVLNNLHWNGYGKEHQHAGSKYFYPGLSEGFHKIGLWWKKNEYIFFVDDVEVWRTSVAVSARPEYLILSLEVGKWAGNIYDANLPDSIIVDYVRVYDQRP